VTNLLVFKEWMKNIYDRIEIYAKPFLKFFVALIIFFMINSQMGYNAKLTSLPVVLGCSLVSAFTPSGVLLFLAAAISVGHIMSNSLILGGIVVIIYLILFLMFTRYTPELSLVVAAVPVLYVLKVPFFIPLLLGLVSTPAAVIPVACGVIIYYLFEVVKVVTSTNPGNSIEEILSVFKMFVDGFGSNKNMFLAVAVFTAVLLITYFISRFPMDYGFYVAILVGSIVNVLGFLMGDLFLNLDLDIVAVIVQTIISAVIVFVVWFFRLSLDYTAVERVQFEDDDYYYYVKAVPKMKVAAPEKKIKTISEQKENISADED